MFTRVILTLALVLPIAAQAEDMFRWRDARGRIHYSNDTEKVPEGAQVVTKKLGEISGAPIGEAMPAPTAGPETAAARAPRRLASWGASESCVRDLGMFALPHSSVDLDRPWWYGIDYVCGQQHDIEGWLRNAAFSLELRKIGL